MPWGDVAHEVHSQCCTSRAWRMGMLGKHGAGMLSVFCTVFTASTKGRSWTSQSVLHGEGSPLRKCNDPCTSRRLKGRQTRYQEFAPGPTDARVLASGHPWPKGPIVTLQQGHAPYPSDLSDTRRIPAALSRPWDRWTAAWTAGGATAAALRARRPRQVPCHTVFLRKECQMYLRCARLRRVAPHSFGV